MSGCQRQLHATKCLLQYDGIVKQTYVPSLLQALHFREGSFPLLVISLHKERSICLIALSI